MLRRELIVSDGLIAQEELARREGATAGQQVCVLRDGGPERGFSLLMPGVMLERGERVVIYAFDTRSGEDLSAINALFSSYYISRQSGLWPDERELIDQLLPEVGAEVLEICCGAGRTAPSLVKQGNRVTAIDLSEECIKHAAAVDRAGVDYRVADASELPFADRSFDFGFCFENSLGTLFSPRAQVVGELLRVSRKIVVLGLRELAQVPENEVQIYCTRSGFLEVAHVHTRASVRRILGSLPAATTARIAGQRWVDGAPRPWGGREFHLILELG